LKDFIKFLNWTVSDVVSYTQWMQNLSKANLTLLSLKLVRGTKFKWKLDITI
jgi:hypothetical protein